MNRFISFFIFSILFENIFVSGKMSASGIAVLVYLEIFGFSFG